MNMLFGSALEPAWNQRIVQPMHLAPPARVRPEQEPVTACCPKRKLSSRLPAPARLGLGLGLGGMLLVHQNPRTSRLEFRLRELSDPPLLLELTNLAHKFSTRTITLPTSEGNITRSMVKIQTCREDGAHAVNYRSVYLFTAFGGRSCPLQSSYQSG